MGDGELVFVRVNSRVDVPAGDVHGAGMSTVVEIEEALDALPRPEQEVVWQHLSHRLFSTGSNSAKPQEAGVALWAGARERLRRIWGDRVLDEREVAAMRDYEDGE